MYSCVSVGVCGVCGVCVENRVGGGGNGHPTGDTMDTHAPHPGGGPLAIGDSAHALYPQHCPTVLAVRSR
jgi:hypothetical protein